MKPNNKFKIALLAGDGIGPEVTREGVKILKALEGMSDVSFEIQDALVGGCAYDQTGTPLPKETLDLARNSDAILLGAVGGPKWESLDISVRPEKALLKLRSELGLFANLRPATVYPELADASTLKKEVVSGVDIMVVRELTGGIYFGEPRGIFIENGEPVGRNTLVYATSEIDRIANVAFEVARKRRKNVVSVDKANVLESTELWRHRVSYRHSQYPDVQLSHMYVDNAAMQLVRRPSQFDVIVTTNMFGDILSDIAAMLTGSIGMLPSASLNETKRGMYEPVHGSAPDIAGQNKANPLATILSVAMMFRYSFELDVLAERIESAVKQVLRDGYRTADIFTEGTKHVGTVEMGDLVCERLTAK